MEEFSRWKSALADRTDVSSIPTPSSTTCLWPGPARACRPNTTRRATSARPSCATSRRGSWPSPRDAIKTAAGSRRPIETTLTLVENDGRLELEQGLEVRRLGQAASELQPSVCPGARRGNGRSCSRAQSRISSPSRSGRPSLSDRLRLCSCKNSWYSRFRSGLRPAVRYPDGAGLTRASCSRLRLSRPSCVAASGRDSTATG
jgi:hypothetical protein